MKTIIKNNIKIFFVLLLLSIVFSCKKESKETIDNRKNNFDTILIYYNSFDDSKSLEGWIFNMNIVYDNHVPIDSSVRSLYVSGGCEMPHAELHIGPWPDTMRLIYKVWAKNLTEGGVVGLTFNDGSDQGLYSFVNDNSWVKYCPKDYLLCPPGKAVKLDFVSGGIFSSSMLVDELEIKNLKIH